MGDTAVGILPALRTPIHSHSRPCLRTSRGRGLRTAGARPGRRAEGCRGCGWLFGWAGRVRSWPFSRSPAPEARAPELVGSCFAWGSRCLPRPPAASAAGCSGSGAAGTRLPLQGAGVVGAGLRPNTRLGVPSSGSREPLLLQFLAPSLPACLLPAQGAIRSEVLKATSHTLRAQAGGTGNSDPVLIH